MAFTYDPVGGGGGGASTPAEVRTLLATMDSGGSTVLVTDIGGYDAYEIIIDKFKPSNDQASLYITPMTGGGVTLQNTGSDNAAIGMLDSTGAIFTGVQAQKWVAATGVANNFNNADCCAFFNIRKANITNKYIGFGYFRSADTDPVSGHGFSLIQSNDTTAALFTDLRFEASPGTITTIRGFIYGLGTRTV